MSKATGSAAKDPPYFDFVHLAYEYATGIDNENEAKIAQLLSTVVGRTKNKEKQRTE